MTLEVSEGGLTVESARLCEPGDSIRVQLPNGQWTRAGESPAIIVHVEIRPGTAAQRVGIAWERNYKAKSPSQPASRRVASRSAFS